MILAYMGRIPTVGDTVTIGDYILEVVDMDGRRIDRVLIRPKQDVNAPSERENQ
jgi:putative hemolysin